MAGTLPVEQAEQEREKLTKRPREVPLLVQNHPDVLLLPPNGPLRLFQIEQARHLKQALTFLPAGGGKKIFLLPEADRMDRAAANSLLKSLEEPPPYALLLLTNLCLARALFGPELPVLTVIAIVPMVLLASGVPITPFGNAGVLEGLFAELLGYAGIAQGALLGLLLRSVFWTWALVGAAVLMLRRVGGGPAPLASMEEA